MTTQDNAGNSDNKDNVNKQGDDQSRNDLNKNGAGQSQTFDVSKIGDEDFKKVFDDPRLWQHSRFKSLSERAKQAETLEKEKAEAEKARMVEQGKFKELAELKSKEADDLRAKVAQATVDNKIIALATKAGVVDTEAVLKLIDRSGIKVDGETIEGVDVAIKGLLETKPYLKGNANLSIGSGSAPNNQNATAKHFKLSQLQDPVFYRANEKDIEQASKLGFIEDDMTKK